MARPRKPANVLEFTGAFKRNPQRRRVDLEGVGPFDPNPPAHLPVELVPSWKQIVSQINPAVLTASDGLSIEVMAKTLLNFRMSGHQAFASELRQWFSQYGMTASGRAKLSAPPKGPKGNAYVDV